MKKTRIFILFSTCLIIFGGITYAIVKTWIFEQKSATNVTIAIMQDDQVQDFEQNYLTTWLEEKTGYEISFDYIPVNYSQEYMEALLSAKTSTIDAVFFPSNQSLLTGKEFSQHVSLGHIKNLTDYIDGNSHYEQILTQYSSEQLQSKVTSPDGGIYYFPWLDLSKKQRNFQVLWMNISWLKKLDLKIPQTTKEMEQTLTAFKQKDPNGNGEQDELPLLCCAQEQALQSYHYLLSPFADKNMKDPNKLKNGVQYVKNLYKKDLLVQNSFILTKKQMQELVNSPDNLVGAFTSQSISDIVYANSPDVIAKYIQVPPLKGESGEQNSIYVEPEVKVGGFIPNNCQHPEEAFQIMDLMLSNEASLISKFGEQGVDWEYSNGSDLSVYGTKAKITTVHYLFDKVQNQNFNGAGPQLVAEEYLDGVTWNGDSSDVEYIDTRAVMNYATFYRTNFSGWSNYLETYDTRLKHSISDLLQDK